MPEPTAVTATAARRGFTRLCARAANGERITIEAHGRAVVVLVSPADAALLEAIESFVVARGLRPDETAEDWGDVFPGLAELEL